MICVRSSLYCSSAALAARGSAWPSRPARWTNIWVWKAAPLAQCLRDLEEQNTPQHYFSLTTTQNPSLLHVLPLPLYSMLCGVLPCATLPPPPLYAALLYDTNTVLTSIYCILSPGVTVSPQQTGLQLGEGEAELGLKSDGVLDQPAFVTQVDPTALQVLLHHLLELPDSLLQVEINALNRLIAVWFQQSGFFRFGDL